MGSIYEERLKKARAWMKEDGTDLLLLSASSDLRYLFGMKGFLMERLSCVIVSADDVHFIAPVFEVGNYAPEILALMEVHPWTDGTAPFGIVKEILPEGERKMAIGATVPSWILLGFQAARPAYRCCSAEPLMRALRTVKDETEYRLLKKAQERSCRALLRLMEHGVAGMTELEAGKLFVQYSEEEGISCGVPIVAAGPNTALPHHEADDTLIRKGDVFLIDFGGDNATEGYIADTTRTFAVSTVPDGLPEIFDIVKAANQAAFEAAKPGVPACEVDRAARDVITKAGYGEYFTHRLGHGIGLDTHEHPYISADNKQPLEVGNAFSDEPGIYLTGRFGVRIEDQLFIKENGAERLTPLDHDLHVID